MHLKLDQTEWQSISERKQALNCFYLILFATFKAQSKNDRQSRRDYLTAIMFSCFFHAEEETINRKLKATTNY